LEVACTNISLLVGKIKKEKTKWKEGEPPGLLGGGKIFSFQY
jgi:hypothetical protein